MTASYEPVRVGSIFRSSWGYDQTNVDFYEVTSISAAGKTVTVRQICSTSDDPTEWSSVRVVPLREPHPWNTDTMTKRLRPAYGGGMAFRVTSYSTAYQWDGTPASETGAHFGR